MQRLSKTTEFPALGVGQTVAVFVGDRNHLHGYGRILQMDEEKALAVVHSAVDGKLYTCPFGTIEPRVIPKSVTYSIMKKKSA